MKKSSKQYVISSEAKNSNGFKVRTAGISLTDYNANPLMLWMHKRPKGERKDEILAPGNMVDIEMKDNKLIGRPSFDDTDDFAMELYSKYENGTYRMLSPGLIPLEWSKDVDGTIWLEKSKLKEVSLCDIGSNPEALPVLLYDEDYNVIELSLDDINTNFFKPQIPMKTIELAALAALPMLKLSADASSEDAVKAVQELITLADTQEKEIIKLKDARDDYKTKFEAEVKKADEAKIVQLMDSNEGKKFLKGDREKWVALAEKDFDGTKAILDSLPEHKTAMEQLKAEEADDSLLKLSYDELDKSGKLMQLKEENLPAFKEKFKAKFNTEYKES